MKISRELKYHENYLLNYKQLIFTKLDEIHSISITISFYFIFISIYLI